MFSFRLNSKIELCHNDEEKRIEGLIYDIVGEKLYISITSDDKKFKLLYVGDYIKGFVFNHLTGVSFEANITNRIAGDIPVYEVSELRNFEEVQRRKDIRVCCNMPIMYSDNEYILNLNIKNIQMQLQDVIKYLNEGVISDLSAGGVKFICDKRFNINTTLLLLFDLEDKHIVVKAKILYKDINIKTKRALYTYGAQFIELDDNQREKIIKHLFVIMRKNRL